MQSYGFELLKEQNIPELNTWAYLYHHVKTGARLLSLVNTDENKVFGITFRTPPADSTGLPHIMEHSVLCGSHKYPVKEPFVELMKGSLNTFLNALTFPDKTTYPVASQNLQDFYNLIDVYMDAVLHPLITSSTFQQEGWHYELADIDSPLNYKGVVYNEMKGAYSSPENLMYKLVQQSLFSDHTYGVDSGGDPAYIPQLTYQQFIHFHQTYYHPSNSYIFFYGDDDPEERLRRMAAYLDGYERIKVSSSVPLRPKFESPSRLEFPYEVSREEKQDNLAKKYMQTTSWMLSERSDPEEILGLHVLTHILIGTPASPLRKMLIDSGLGEDLIGVGLEDDLRQPYFSTGLKGISIDDSPQVENLIIEGLDQLARDGIDPGTVAASMNTIEFRLRENNAGHYPRGLLLMLRALTTWLHDGDPFMPLAFDAPLTAIKKHLGAGEPYFENLISSKLQNNPHRVTVLLKPDPDLRQRETQAEQDRLARMRQSMTPADINGIFENMQELKKRQGEPDSPEDLAKIPVLSLDDLDKKVKNIPSGEMDIDETTLLSHDLFTNGIVYLDLGLDIHTLPSDLISYATLFGRALLEMGTEKESFVQLSQRIGRTTGGIQPATFVAARMGNNDVFARPCAAWLFLRGKATIDQAGELLSILKDVLLSANLNNPERFRQIVLEEKADMEASLAPAGHRMVNLRLRAQFDEAGWAAEKISGISYLTFLRELGALIEKDWASVLGHLEKIRQILVNRSSMLLNLTVDHQGQHVFLPQLMDFLRKLPGKPFEKITWQYQLLPDGEGLTIPAQVNYVAKGANLYQMGYKLHGSIDVITNFLGATWLWERVRVQGGAYGCFCLFDHRSGVLSYLSYRDPNISTTLTNYDQTSTFLQQLDEGRLSSQELTKSIIGAIGNMDAYQLPDAKGYTALLRRLVGFTDECRQQMRDEILSTTLEDFHHFGAILAKVSEHGRVTVLGSHEAIQAANIDCQNRLKLLKVL